MNTRRFVLLLSLALGLAASEVRAQKPRGRDFPISPQIAAQQGSANVATAPDGSFVAVCSPSLISSPVPPTSVATTGVCKAMVSRTTLGGKPWKLG